MSEVDTSACGTMTGRVVKWEAVLTILNVIVFLLLFWEDQLYNIFKGKSKAKK